MAKKKFDIKNNLLGGAFLTRSQMAGQWVFILYIFGLIFLYITLNLAVINTQKASSRNLRELKKPQGRLHQQGSQAPGPEQPQRDHPQAAAERIFPQGPYRAGKESEKIWF
jgi:hypothetical protein